jgi:hypothetical protein
MWRSSRRGSALNGSRPTAARGFKWGSVVSSDRSGSPGWCTGGPSFCPLLLVPRTLPGGWETRASRTPPGRYTRDGIVLSRRLQYGRSGGDLSVPPLQEGESRSEFFLLLIVLSLLSHPVSAFGFHDRPFLLRDSQRQQQHVRPRPQFLARWVPQAGNVPRLGQPPFFPGVPHYSRSGRPGRPRPRRDGARGRGESPACACGNTSDTGVSSEAPGGPGRLAGPYTTLEAVPFLNPQREVQKGGASFKQFACRGPSILRTGRVLR